jgi:DMSO/TMAO reductase YedYZ heme-binding membrane subunit
LEIAEEMQKKLKVIKVLVVIFLLSLVYSVVQFIVIRDMPWSNLPLLIANKAIAWTSLVSICLSYLTGIFQKTGKRILSGFLPLRKYLGMYGFYLAMVHIMITLSILTADRFPALYDGIRINSKGENVILFGMLCLCGFIMPAISSVKAVRESISTEKWKRIQQIGYGALLANFFHVFSLDYEIWFVTNNWIGNMPPITMIAAVVSMLTLFMKLYTLLLNKK